MSESKTVAVLGAGPAGLSCAYSLLEQGYKVEIFEESPYVGGMCRSFELFDQVVDVGPHRFFSKLDRVNNFWKNCFASKDDLLMVERLSRIYYNGKFFYYPLRGWDALKKLGFISSFLCVCSYAKARLMPFKGDDFETWVSNAFGHRLFKIFFKTYSEKLWGIKCKDLDKAFAAQRIKGFNLMEAAKTAFFGNKDHHQTLLSHFLYPKFGCGQAYDALAEKFEANSGIIHRNCKAVGINVENGKAVGIQYVNLSKENITPPTPKKILSKKFDIVVSTAVFTDMVKSLPELPQDILNLTNTLRFRNTILVFIEVDKDKVFDDNWLYIHSPDVATGRIANFSNWSHFAKRGHKESILCMEYWANNEDALWQQSDEQLIAQAKQDLKTLKFATDSELMRGSVLKIEKSYPIYEAGYLKRLEPITKYLDGIKDLYFIGRNGSFKYNNQDHSLLMGLLCADKITGKYNGSLWEVNSDSNYQEEGKIDK